MAIIITQHAFDQMERRMNLLPQQAIDIINAGKTLNLGLEPGTHKMHMLFYSHPDAQCFVAVVDQKDGVIITILPHDYDRHCRVSYETVLAFQAQARGEIHHASTQLPPYGK